MSMVGLALRRPRVIPHLLGAAWTFRARGWYRRFPFVPLPPQSYMRWRLETAYGDPEHHPTDDDLLRYLAWTAAMRRERNRRPRA